MHAAVHAQRPTWKDALEFVLLGTPAFHAEQLRDPLIAPRGPGFQDELKKKLCNFALAIASGDIPFDKEEFQKYVAKRRSSA